MAVDWRDATAWNEPLVGMAPPISPNRSVLLGTNAKFGGGGFVGGGEGTNRMMTITSQDATRLVFASTHVWTIGTSSVGARIENEIDVNGIWQLTVTVTVGTENANIDSPHETRPFRANGHMDVVTLGDFTLGRGVFEPGWK